MNKQLPTVGSVVLAKAGRDAGRLFVVLDVIDDAYLMLCDGKLRKVEKPKKKKIRHVRLLPYRMEAAAEAQANRQILNNYEVRDYLKAIGYNT